MMRSLSLLLAFLALTLFIAAPVFAEPRGEATRSAEIAVPDPFAVPADAPDTRWEGRLRPAQPSVSRHEDERVLDLELKRADVPAATPAPTPAQKPTVTERHGNTPPVPELDLRGF